MGNDTSLGGSAGGFPDTSWSVIARLDATRSEESRVHFEALCRRYWKPLYRYLRVSRRCSNDDAKDLVQGFFLWLMDAEALRKFAPQRGGFRTYLKLLLKGYAWKQDEARARLKRGGGAAIVPLEGIDEPDSAADSPDAAFESAWREQILREALQRVERRWAGREEQFRVFREYDVKQAEESYEQLGARLGMTAAAVRTGLAAVREAMREEIRAELAKLTADPAELEEEWNAFLGR